MNARNARARRALETGVGVFASRRAPRLPDRAHPVAWFGRAASALEGRSWRDDKASGVRYAVLGSGLGWIAGKVVPTVAATATTVAGQQLRDVAVEIADLLDAGELHAARELLPSLVGRDPAALDEAGIAAAVIESVAENTVDAVVAPALWGSLLGGAGAGAYRAINTLDAMVGHRSTRYLNFGWASARLDDVANWVPARLTGALFAALGDESAVAVARVIRADAPAHPSPNAGVAEAAMAAALGVQLGGTLSYAGRVEQRPTLGDGPRPSSTDIHRAVALAQRAETVLAGSMIVISVVQLARGGWAARAVTLVRARR